MAHQAVQPLPIVRRLNLQPPSLHRYSLQRALDQWPSSPAAQQSIGISAGDVRSVKASSPLGWLTDAPFSSLRPPSSITAAWQRRGDVGGDVGEKVWWGVTVRPDGREKSSAEWKARASACHPPRQTMHGRRHCAPSPPPLTRCWTKDQGAR